MLKDGFSCKGRKHEEWGDIYQMYELQLRVVRNLSTDLNLFKGDMIEHFFLIAISRNEKAEGNH